MKLLFLILIYYVVYVIILAYVFKLVFYWGYDISSCYFFNVMK